MNMPMDVSNGADVSANVRQSSASEIGRKRASDYLREVFDTPPKSRRLEIASQIKMLETRRNKAVNRIKKTKHQLRDLAARLKADETERAQLDEQIHSLKSENAAE